MTQRRFSGIYQRMDTKVNKNLAGNSHFPIYLRVRDMLVAQIEKSELKPHAPLPSERVLAEQFEISRMTARRALAEVEKAGYAYRLGRKGRFVADQRLSYDVGKTLSFAARALRDSINLSIEVISASTENADTALANKLEVESGTLVHVYKRVFRVAGKTVLVERETALAEVFPDLLEQDLGQPSTLLHESRYGVIGSNARITFRCSRISPEDRELFDDDCAPYGMEMESVIIDAQGKPFCCGHQIWSGELAEFTLLATPG
jgi:GntR family transcriptional regulator